MAIPIFFSPFPDLTLFSGQCDFLLLFLLSLFPSLFLGVAFSRLSGTTSARSPLCA
jgi:hypothetical protein